jgi:hypothetical protein
MNRSTPLLAGDDVLTTAVNQLSLVSAAMKMLLETCERELLEAADQADPGPDHGRSDHGTQGTGRHQPARYRQGRLRAR